MNEKWVRSISGVRMTDRIGPTQRWIWVPVLIFQPHVTEEMAQRSNRVVRTELQ
jgi:hypothetical protein